MRAYCDHAATTPLCDEAWRAMEPYLRARFGNPSEPHAEGRAARAGLDVAREQVARALGTADDEVVFTAGGSEADNLAVLGRLAGRPGRVVTTHLEHPAVARAFPDGSEIAFARVTADGVVDLDSLDELVRPGDRLCAVIWASNVTGAIQPVRAIAALCAARGVPLHLDAVQAAAWLPLRLDELPGEITVAVAAHKLHGPKAAGALAGRGVSTLVPVFHGGGQERGLRPGTESVAQATGLAVALTRRLADSQVAGATAAMRDDYEACLRRALPDVDLAAERVARLPGHSLALIPGLRADTLCALADEQGFAVSAGSACASGEAEPSLALGAMGVPRALALGAARATFGELNAPDDGRRLAEALARLVPALRVASAAVGA